MALRSHSSQREEEDVSRKVHGDEGRQRNLTDNEKLRLSTLDRVRLTSEQSSSPHHQPVHVVVPLHEAEVEAPKTERSQNPAAGLKTNPLPDV